jgi:hypothetical protein
MIEIARIIQATQIVYQRSSHKATQPSSWKANIEKKIEGLKSLIIMLERVLKLEKLEKNDKSKVLAFMSQEKFRMASALDAKEAISRCNERILVYAKKIEMHEKRKVFFRQNASFELYRRRFYKSLESTEVVVHQVTTTKIKEF